MKMYLVGDKNSEKSNEYLAVCKTYEEAERLLREIKAATLIKETTHESNRRNR